MKISLLIMLIVFLLLFQPVYAVREYSVGVSPPIVDLGEINRGTKIVHFFIITVSDEPLLVYLEPSEALLDFFDKPEYRDKLNNYSEERIASWVEILSNPVELKPSGSISSGIKGWREVEFLLNVPPDAEPGYHLVRIRPRPYVFESAKGTVGVQIATVTPVAVFFKLEGTALRQGKILDITGDYGRNGITAYVHFLNTGTVTLSARVSKIDVYNDGRLIATGSSSSMLVKPGEKKVLTALLPADNLTYGEYKVYANVDFLTGHVEKNSTISLYPPPVTQPTIPPSPIVIPIWIIILIICIIIAPILWHIHENV